MNKIDVSIDGMSCTGCEQTIQTSVAKLEGIKSVTADFTKGRAKIEYYPGVTDTNMIRDAITGCGYSVKEFLKWNEPDTIK